MTDILEIAQKALESEYGLAAIIRPLPGELDLNFDVKTDNARFVFKIMRADCDPQFIDLQIKAMDWVRDKGMNEFVPAVMPARGGDKLISIQDEQGAKRLGWLISFLPGKLMADIDPCPLDLATSIGETMGKMCVALEDFEHPLLDRDLKWDLRQAGWIGEHLSVFRNENQRRIVEGVFDEFTQRVSPILESMPRFAIHADANDMNILVHAQGPQEGLVSGVFDFGDMVRAPQICDIAIALAYAMMGSGDTLARAASLVAGFKKHVPLSDIDCGLILPLVRTRLSITVTNAAIEKSANPENEYLSISEAPAWDLLKKLDAINEETAAELFVEATPQRQKDEDHSAKLLQRRQAISPHNQKLSYDNPVHFVRGEKHFLFDAEGKEYLDAYNNVPHVGHANPHVVDAVRRQMSLITTNTRYLQDIHVAYGERMIALLPAPLTKIVFLNSASEANEFALRLARSATGARDMLVMDHGYHGGTTGAMDISPYKFRHPKGAGAPPDWVHVTPQPDIYRGAHRGEDASAKYTEDAKTILDGAIANGKSIAGFISECAPSVGGQIMLPAGYLNAVYDMVRKAGGVAIADDVQTALGRLGDFFWGFDQQGVAPDIAVFGKPLGNGFPLAAVAMNDEIAAAFAEGPEFFSTFGGSSAACAAGNAVLDVLQNENLADNARTTGGKIKNALCVLAEQYEIIGDVRGHGFFLGLDLVQDRQSREPATRQASFIKNRMREERILIGVEGPADNVLKIRPPMTFDDAAADRLLNRLEQILREPEAQP